VSVRRIFGARPRDGPPGGRREDPAQRAVPFTLKTLNDVSVTSAFRVSTS